MILASQGSGYVPGTHGAGLRAAEHSAGRRGQPTATAAAIIAANPAAKAYLGLLGDKEFIIDARAGALAMFARRRRTWIMLGDPVGPGHAAPDLVARFVERCRAEGATPALHEISGAMLPVCASLGLAAFGIAEEARVRLGEFSLDGSDNRTLRNAVKRAQAAGCSFEVVGRHGLSGERMRELRGVSGAWLAARKGREKRFSMGCFDPDYLRHFELAVVRREGRAVAFASAWSGQGGSELFIDLMRSRPDAPRGSMDFLVVSLASWAKSVGYETLNLGMAPLGAVPVPSSRLAAWAVALARRCGGGLYNFAGLRQFKAKFHPEWRPRYFAAPPGVATAAALVDLLVLVAGGWRGVLWK